MCLPGECCVVGRQRVQRAGGHQKGTSKEGGGMLPSSSVFRSGMVPDGGCSPEGVGRVCRSDQGGVWFPGGREGVVCGVLSPSQRGGGIVRTSSPSLPGGRPPLVQHRPRVTYSGTAKGPLLGGLPIVSGLEGVCEA